MKRLRQSFQIIEGYTKAFFGIKTSLEDDRRTICNICDLNVKGICSKELGGCGCSIEKKIKCTSCKCPLQKW